MTEMIERVARAILRSHLLNTYTMDEFVQERIDDEWPMWVDEARAAIGAMREPTKAMLDEGPIEPYMDAFVWAKMIDAALKGEG